MAIVDFTLRYLHVFAGILWIGLLYYFNFVQAEYFKEAEASAKGDAVQKLVPRALLYFRHAALLTFITGFLLLTILYHGDFSKDAVPLLSGAIIVGATMGTIMMLNVWFIIWPNQKLVIAGAENAAAAGAKAALASRTNTILSFPMLLMMLASTHQGAIATGYLGVNLEVPGMIIGLIVAFGVEANAIFGKMLPVFASVKGSIITGVVLAAIVNLGFYLF